MTSTPATDLSGRTVLITGASRGLGRALALAFGRAGATVALCARSLEPVQEVAREVEAAGGTATAATVDVTRPAEVRDWVEEVRARSGRPHVLINNASVLGPRADLADTAAEDWTRTIEVNLNGVFHVTRACLPAMREAGEGLIVNISSGAAVPPRAGWSAYAVSKAAVDVLTRNLAEEERDHGIRVVSVDPGAMRTEMRVAAYPEEGPATVKTPEEATAVFLWLAGPEGRSVTGERLRADEFRGA
jgi:NAD(P)-dependent dehydrogenase (short-subunit alcohol dehydrogenase family)